MFLPPQIAEQTGRIFCLVDWLNKIQRLIALWRPQRLWSLDKLAFTFTIDTVDFCLIVHYSSLKKWFIVLYQSVFLSWWVYSEWRFWKTAFSYKIRLSDITDLSFQAILWLINFDYFLFSVVISFLYDILLRVCGSKTG